MITYFPICIAFMLKQMTPVRMTHCGGFIVAHLDTGLSNRGERGVLEVQTQPGQQAEDREGQLVLGVSKQGCQALVGAPLPLSLPHYAHTGDILRLFVASKGRP